MADTTTAVAATPAAPKKPTIEQPKDPIILEVTRNDVSVKFTEQRTTRGKDPGKTVFDPEVTDEAKFLLWIGVDASIVEALKSAVGKASTTMSNAVSLLRGKVRNLSQGWAEASIDTDSKEFTKHKFIQFASEFSARGETIGELEEQMEEAQGELVNMDMSNKSPENQTKMFEIFGKIQKLTIAIESKRRPRDEKEEKPANGTPATATASPTKIAA